MDCYFGSGVDDLVVPRDQEPIDRLPSPNSWSLWGVSASEAFKSTNKYFTTKKSSIGEEPNFYREGLYEEVGMDLSADEVEHSNNSNVHRGFQKGSRQQATSSWESPDYQLGDSSGSNQADDVFMSSLLEEDSTDMIIESDYDSSHLFGMASSKYLKTHAFSPPMDWEVNTLHSPHNLRQKDNTALKAMVAKLGASPDLDIKKSHVNKETSLEASVLHELERVTSQFSEKTRICFRDALYRLAKNSEQHTVNHSQNGDLIPDKLPQLTVCDETLRSGKMKTAESETNAIDRAVANLLFTKMDSEEEAQDDDLPVKEAKGTKRHYNYSFCQPQLPPHYPYHNMSFTGDAEVPIFN